MNTHEHLRTALVVDPETETLFQVTQLLAEEQYYFDVNHAPDAALTLIAGVRFGVVILVSEDSLPPDFAALLPRLAETRPEERTILISKSSPTSTAVSSRIVEAVPEDVPSKLPRALKLWTQFSSPLTPNRHRTAAEPIRASRLSPNVRS